VPLGIIKLLDILFGMVRESLFCVIVSINSAFRHNQTVGHSNRYGLCEFFV